ncbi:chitin deacetylase 7-like [Littorina saxatilis]|uniref:NodB homology domain-containing protein n=1 Tax=Littorina saxatilis TaxID=31220 RepID=A0AAN9GNY5_9CAEN
MIARVIVALSVLSHGCWAAALPGCVQKQNCHLPDCFCPTFNHPDFQKVKDIPQMVYFGFDDALTVQVDTFYKQLFKESRRNPNGCPISMSLYVQHQYTDYSLVKSNYEKGNEIGSHSVTHTNVDTEAKLLYEAGTQKDNLISLGKVPSDQVVGWRSPNLKPAGDAQPEVLKSLNYTYDITLTYTRASADDNVPWPYTLDYGYPYSCGVAPCPSSDVSHPGFWEIPVSALYDPVSNFPCAYVDSCRPSGEDAAFNYLWSNFEKVYTSNRAPFGLNMHAAFFYFPGYLEATNTFLDRLLQKDDVYIVTAKQVLDWMRNPVKVSDISQLPEFNCEAPQPRSTTPRPATVQPDASTTSNPSDSETTPALPDSNTTPAVSTLPEQTCERNLLECRSRCPP